MKNFLCSAITLLLSTFLLSYLMAFPSFLDNQKANTLLNDSLSIRVYLQGPLVNNGNLVHEGRPLMRDNLRQSPFNNKRYIPLQSPYAFDPYYTMMSERYSPVGLQTNIILDSTIFNISGPDAIVDWVFVEVRNQFNYNHVLATRSCLLQRDGDLVDLDGVSKLSIPNLTVTEGYIVIKHRNHLAVMSKVVSFETIIDFTNPSFLSFDYGTTMISHFDYTNSAQKKNVKLGFSAMWAGDFDGGGKIKTDHPHDDVNMLFQGVIQHSTNDSGSSNFDFGYGYQAMDFDLNSKVKFDNPNDDRNMQFAQIISYSLNTKLLGNFDHFIEQVPASTIR
jgi:hypothetical protein